MNWRAIGISDADIETGSADVDVADVEGAGAGAYSAAIVGIRNPSRPPTARVPKTAPILRVHRRRRIAAPYAPWMPSDCTPSHIKRVFRRPWVCGRYVYARVAVHRSSSSKPHAHRMCTRDR